MRKVQIDFQAFRQNGKNLMIFAVFSAIFTVF